MPVLNSFPKNGAEGQTAIKSGSAYSAAANIQPEEQKRLG